MDLKEITKQARLTLLTMHYNAKVGHLGGNLSCIDILCSLFHKTLTDNDVFILSKGHAAGALYVTLASRNLISAQSLSTFHQDNTILAGHPPSKGIKQIPFGTGSLGHGLPISAGTALARRLAKKSGDVYCLMSDGEWNEGSNWEALIFASHQQLENLNIIIDCNGLQGMGRTAEIANLIPFKSKFESFGLQTIEIDGHNLDQISDALAEPHLNQQPKIIIANTVKGKGVSYMENCFEWHYWPMSQEQYQLATKEVSDQ